MQLDIRLELNAPAHTKKSNIYDRIFKTTNAKPQNQSDMKIHSDEIGIQMKPPREDECYWHIS